MSCSRARAKHLSCQFILKVCTKYFLRFFTTLSQKSRCTGETECISVQVCPPAQFRQRPRRRQRSCRRRQKMEEKKKDDRTREEKSGVYTCTAAAAGGLHLATGHVPGPIKMIRVAPHCVQTYLRQLLMLQCGPRTEQLSGKAPRQPTTV